MGVGDDGVCVDCPFLDWCVMAGNIASSGAEAYEITGRWVAIPPLGEEDCDTPEKYERWERTIQEPDRLYLDGDDTRAREFEWEWVEYEPDQIPVPNGRYVGWRCA